MTYRDGIVELAAKRGWTRGAQLGLGTVALLEMLLAALPELHMIAVDHFVRMDRKQRALDVASRSPGRATVLIMTTGQAAPLVPDGSLDFAFIDAGHKYGCARADIRAWWPKVRPGGWFGGYGYNDLHPGTQRAVDERFGGNANINNDNVWSVEKR